MVITNRIIGQIGQFNPVIMNPGYNEKMACPELFVTTELHYISIDSPYFLYYNLNAKSMNSSHTKLMWSYTNSSFYSILTVLCRLKIFRHHSNPQHSHLNLRIKIYSSWHLFHNPVYFVCQWTRQKVVEDFFRISVTQNESPERPVTLMLGQFWAEDVEQEWFLTLWNSNLQKIRLWALTDLVLNLSYVPEMVGSSPGYLNAEQKC